MQSRHSTVPSGLLLLNVIRAKGRKTGRTAGPRGRHSRHEEGRAGALWYQESCSFSGTAQDSGRPPGVSVPLQAPCPALSQEPGKLPSWIRSDTQQHAHTPAPVPSSSTDRSLRREVKVMSVTDPMCGTNCRNTC